MGGSLSQKIGASKLKVMGGGGLPTLDEIQFFYEGSPKPSKGYREVPQMGTTQKDSFMIYV